MGEEGHLGGTYAWLLGHEGSNTHAFIMPRAIYTQDLLTFPMIMIFQQKCFKTSANSSTVTESSECVKETRKKLLAVIAENSFQYSAVPLAASPRMTSCGVRVI